MKKIIAVIFILLTALLLAACDNRPAGAGYFEAEANGLEAEFERIRENSQLPMGYEWIEFDLNGDGIDELILRHERGRIASIYVFDYESQEAILVYHHNAGIARGMFISENGNLMHLNFFNGWFNWVNYTHYKFDDEWNLVRLSNLNATLVYDMSEMPEDWAETNPDMAEVGIYFHYNGEAVYRDQFLEMFQEMLGTSFYNMLPEWYDWWINFGSQTALATTFTTTARIHENMPEFTFFRILGDGYDGWPDDIPEPVDVTIRIEDEDGNVIQVISGLTQSNQWDVIEHNEISFDDYNFDGYLDMRLMRWQDGAGGLLAKEYFWLWDATASQFVLNEQLVEIGHAAGLTANQDTRQIMVFNRADETGSFFEIYEYRNGIYILVAHERHSSWREDDRWYTEIIRTDEATDEAIMIIMANGEIVRQAPLWQVKYTALLREHVGQNFYFILHDIDGDGMPELLIFEFIRARSENNTFYTFRNGEMVSLEAYVGFSAESLFTIPGEYSAIFNNFTTMYSEYVMRVTIDGNNIVITHEGFTTPSEEGREISRDKGLEHIWRDIQWYRFEINGEAVTAEEFTDIFGWDWSERAWLEPILITEESISTMIGGIQ
ncbi:MAG: hypothetical protein FWC76_00475 [Defluviitaleaceae bacterium]|nr:hypothetical protein [Defluviitaleaceae bacterium]